jgi:hypothetical protein
LYPAARIQERSNIWAKRQLRGPKRVTVTDKKVEDFIRQVRACLEVAERMSLREERDRALALAEQWLRLAREALSKMN